MLASAPERAGRIRFSDVYSAAKGNVAAWESLRASVMPGPSDQELRRAETERRGPVPPAAGASVPPEPEAAEQAGPAVVAVDALEPAVILEPRPGPPPAAHRIEQLQSTREPDHTAPSELTAPTRRRHRGMTHHDWHEQAKSCKRLYTNSGKYSSVAGQKKLDVKTVGARIADLEVFDTTGFCPICGAPSSAR